jgi:predicted RNA binding protein YcfA (HicA-like mRNA interferase family)
LSPKYTTLSGRQIVKIFGKLGYEKISQKGSHIKMKNDKSGSVIIIPDHKEVDRWTLKTILKQAEISEQIFMEYL